VVFGLYGVLVPESFWPIWAKHLEVAKVASEVFLISFGLAVTGFLLWAAKKILEGYLPEKGKRLATTEDIEKVLREVELVTAKTEQIRAQFGDTAWRRQTLWNERRALYRDVFRSISAAEEAAHLGLADVRGTNSDLMSTDAARRVLTTKGELMGHLLAGTPIAGKGFRQAVTTFLNMEAREQRRHSSAAERLAPYLDALGLLRANLIVPCQQDLALNELEIDGGPIQPQ